MIKLKPLKYCLNQTAGSLSDSTEFIPYSDHYKMSEEKKKEKPLYCPDMYPILCSLNSNSGKVCRRSKYDCVKNINENKIFRYPMNYFKTNYTA